MEAMKAEGILHKVLSNISQVDLYGSHRGCSLMLSAPLHLTSEEHRRILNQGFVSLLLRVRPATRAFCTEDVLSREQPYIKRLSLLSPR